MKRTLLFLMTALIVAPCACSNANPNLGSLDQPLRVAYQDQVSLPDEELTIVFTAVDEDSRCPVPATCMRAGQATIGIALSKRGVPVEPRALTIGPSPGTNVVVYDVYTITFLALNPHPKLDQQVVPSDYVATLVVSKSP